MKTSIHSLLVLCLFTGCNSCQLLEAPDPKPKTELEKLPPATQEGKDTFGCLLNGKAWRTTSSTYTTSDYQMGSLQISGVINEPKLQNLGMNLRDGVGGETLTIGAYSLVAPSPHNPMARFYDPSTCTYGGFGNQSEQISGELIITKFDKVNFIISGTFHFTLVKAGCDPDTIKVTDGRFDINYAS